MNRNDANGAEQNRSRLEHIAPAPVSFLRRPKPFDREAAMRAYEKEHPEALEARMQALKNRHAGTNLKIFSSDPQRFFEAGFTEILATRMAGLPIVNAKLSVAATPFVRIRIDQTQAWIGVVVTPWAVMAILAPALREGWRFVPAGGIEEIELAAGTFRFVACADTILGHYRSLSLKSPVFEFQDMASAKAFAQTCLNLLIGREELREQAEPENPILSPQEPQAEPIKEKLTRRELLGRYTQPLAVDLDQQRRQSASDKPPQDATAPEPGTSGEKA